MNRWAFLAVGLALGLVAGLLIPRSRRPAAIITVEDGGRYFVERVVDGDTIQLRNGPKVRYIAVDTPEMGGWQGKKAEPGAQAATDANRELVEEKWVTLRIGPRPWDVYGRVLARVIVEHNGRQIDVGMKLILDGMGRAMRREYNDVNFTAAKRAEAEAQAAGRGIWAGK